MHGRLTGVTSTLPRIRVAARLAPAPVWIAGLAFLFLFWRPMTTLAQDWWSNPDAGQGLLLFPVALYLAWRRGWAPDAAPQPAAGLLLLAGAVVLRYLSGLAAELFTMRLALLAAVVGLVVYRRGLRQVAHWWLPLLLLLFSIPLPVVVVGSLALPLQLKASQLGAVLLRWRHVPVVVAGNVIHLPGRSLFVTEACSGLRSLTALISLGLLIGGLWLRSTWGRWLLVASAIPVAMALNAVRVFLTGFLVFFVSPSLAEGVMHYTEGWTLFVVAFAILGGAAWVLSRLERPRPAAT